MRVLLITALFFTLTASMPAAADNLIRIINEDGSVTEFDLGDDANKPVNTQAPDPVPEEIISEPAPSSHAPREQDIPSLEVIEKSPDQKLSIEDLLEETVPSDTASEKKVYTTKKQKKERKQTKAVTSPRKVTKLGVPIPPRKPPLPDRLLAKQQSIPGTAIPRKLATAIAIENAPPSNGFRVSRGVFEDRPVYVVIFKTDNGPHEVLVDAETGDILKN